MVRDARTAWRLLDLFSAIRPGLTASVFVFCLGFAVSAVAGGGTYPTQYQALQACQADAATNNRQSQAPAGTSYFTCKLENAYTYMQWNTSPNQTPSWFGNIYQWTTAGGFPNPCGTLPSVHMFMEGKMLSGTTFTENQQDAGGNWVPCTMAFTPSGVPTLDPYTGQWQTYGVASPSGNPASTGNPTGAGTSDWVDSSGNPVNPQPAPTTAAPTDNTSPPQICGGGSCYNLATDQYCSTAGGQQYCVSGATARSSTGGCANGSTSVTCGGSPSAPLPNAPQTGVTNPAQNIQSSDQYTQANATTGAAQSVTVNVYTAPGTTSSSGQKSGDAGPAPASSSGSPSSATAGADCNSPPTCSGDAVTCGVMRQEWYAMCSAKAGTDQLHKDLAGTGTPASSSTSANASSLWSDGTNTGNATADAANQGNYDQSGFGIGTTCPLTDLTVNVGDAAFMVPFSKGCVIGDWIRPLVIGMSLLVAAKITAGATG